MKVFIVALLAVVVTTMSAVAQAAVADPAQQAFVAGILRFVGKAMQDHAEDWAGWVLLAFPAVSGLIGWLMPRQWLFAVIKGAASPLLAVGKLIISAANQKGGRK